MNGFSKPGALSRTAKGAPIIAHERADNTAPLEEWGQGPVAVVPEACLHELVEAQVRRTPDAIALVFDRGQGSGSREQESPAFSLQPSAFSLQLNYRELDCRANQLAHHLRRLGVVPEIRVAICMERSLDLMVGLLGILKAGGAYVPLDPTYPSERLSFMLMDAQAPVLLTQAHLLERFLEYSGQTVVIDRDHEIIAAQPEIAPASGVCADNLAYVIYTSGSTGRPKGTMVVHRGVVNYLVWCQQAYPLAAGLGSPVHSSISFDLTVTSLFTPLIAGRRVYLLDGGHDIDPLSTVIREQTDYSLVKITPAHLELLSQQLAPETAADLTHAFVIGGENLLAESIRFWQEHAPNTLLFNEYGPTETVVGCCVYQVPPDERRSGSVPIGRPINNTQLSILDKQLRPVPVGVPGELYIGGMGVARGYLGRPDLTAERFVPNPFAEVSGIGYQVLGAEPSDTRYPAPDTRLYRTGDRACYLPDGNIEFLGRLDQQVKLRGYRIELGEIEKALLHHPAIVQAAVVACEDTAGHKRLVAYVVLQGDPAPSRARLVSFLEEKLPQYMVPRVFTFMSELPRTPNGKLDREALPAPDQFTDLEADFVPPRTQLEQEIAQAFSEVIGIDRVGLNDAFLDLGGDSLMAVRLALRLIQTYDLDLSIIRLYQEPTVAGIAGLIEAYKRDGASSVLMNAEQLEAEAFLAPDIMPEWLQAEPADP